MDLILPRLKTQFSDGIVFKKRGRKIFFSSDLLSEVFRFMDVYHLSESCFLVSWSFLLTSVQLLQKEHCLEQQNREEEISKDLEEFKIRHDFQSRISKVDDDKKSFIFFPPPLIYNICFQKEDKLLVSLFALDRFFFLTSPDRNVIGEAGRAEEEGSKLLGNGDFRISLCLRQIQKFRKSDSPIQLWNISTDTLRFFLSEGNEKMNKMVTYWCCFTGTNPNMVEEILSEGNMKDRLTTTDLLVLTIWGKNLETFKLIHFRCPEKDELNLQELIKMASFVGCFSILMYLLDVRKECKSEELGIDRFAPEKYACSENDFTSEERLEVVKYLLQDEETDPNLMILSASEHGYTNIVELLLRDKRTDPVYKGHQSLSLSSKNNHVEIVNLLLNDERVRTSNVSSSFRNACKKGRSEVVKAFLSHQNIRLSETEYFKSCGFSDHEEKCSIEDLTDLTWGYTKNFGDADEKKSNFGFLVGIREAFRKRHQEVIEILVSDPLFQEFPKKDELMLILGCVGGNLEIVKNSLAELRKRTDGKIKRDSSCIVSASESGSLEVVEFLLKDEKGQFVPSTRAFRTDEGNLALIKLILNDERMSTGVSRWRISSLILRSIEKGRDDIVDYLVSRQKKTDKPLKLKNFEKFIRTAMSHQEEYIVELLYGYCPEIGNDENMKRILRFESYCCTGRLGLARLISNGDSWIDASSHNNYCIRKASSKGHLEVVKYLLEERPEVNPGDEKNRTIRGACFEEHYEIVKLLLGHAMVNPAAENNECVKDILVYSCSTEILELLLEDSRVDPFDEEDLDLDDPEDRDIIQNVCRDFRRILESRLFGKFEMLKMLVGDHRAVGKVRVDRYSEEDNVLISRARRQLFLDEKSGEKMSIIELGEQDLRERIEFLFERQESYFVKKSLVVKTTEFTKAIPFLLIIL